MTNGSARPHTECLYIMPRCKQLRVVYLFLCVSSYGVTTYNQREIEMKRLKPQFSLPFGLIIVRLKCFAHCLVTFVNSRPNADLVHASR